MDHDRDVAAPEVQACIRDSFERQGLMRLLGARLGHVGVGLVRIVLPSRPEVSQQHAVGTVRRSGRTLTVCQLDVFGVTGADRALVATGQQTLIRVDPAPGGSGRSAGGGQARSEVPDA